MGLYLHVHAGPYILATYELREEKQFIKVCPKCNDGSRKGLSAKFCNQCGTEAVSQETKSKSVNYPSYHQYSEEIFNAGHREEAFTNISEGGPRVSENSHLLISNIRPEDQPRNFGIDENNVFLENIDTQAEIEWFKRSFAEEIKVLEELYLEVKIGWAFLHYHQ